jgi:acyl carrier protein
MSRNQVRCVLTEALYTECPDLTLGDDDELVPGAGTFPHVLLIMTAEKLVGTTFTPAQIDAVQTVGALIDLVAEAS